MFLLFSYPLFISRLYDFLTNIFCNYTILYVLYIFYTILGGAGDSDDDDDDFSQTLFGRYYVICIQLSFFVYPTNHSNYIFIVEFNWIS